MKNLLLLIFLLITCNAFAVTTSWTGTSSTSWGKASNWTAGIPTATDDVIIGDANFTGAFQPSLSARRSYCKTLTIGNAAKVSTLSMANNNRHLDVSGDITIGVNGTISHTSKSNLTLTGNWIKTGAYTASNKNSVVIFSGLGQSITGVTSFQQLTINAGCTATLANNITVLEALNISGTFNPQTNLVTLTGASFLLNNGCKVFVYNSTFSGNYSINPTTLRNGSTVEYASASIPQTVAALNYGTLRISGATVKTLAGNITTLSGTGTGNIQIVSGATFDILSYTANRANSASGSFVLSALCTLRVAGIFPINYSSYALASTSLVEYYGGTQTVSAQTYGHLSLLSSSGNVTKTMPSTTITVVGNLISSASAGTLTFSAGNIVNVFGDVTIGASTTFNSVSYSHVFRKNLINNGTIGSTTSTITMLGYNAQVTGTGTFNLNNFTLANPLITAANNVNLNLTGNLTTTGSGTFIHSSGGLATLTMTGTSKVISGLGIQLNNVVISGTITTASSLILDGNLTVNSAKSFTASAGVISFRGASKTITNSATLTFYGINILPTSTITTATSCSILNDFSVQGAFSASAGTLTFNGTSILTGSPNCFNVTVSASKTLQLGNPSVMGIAGTFVRSGTLDVTTSAPNTVMYNGSDAQAVNGTTYHNVIFANGGTKTASAGITVNELLTINSGVTFAGSTFTHQVYGDWVNNGMFTSSGTGTVSFLGSVDAYITGATNFNIITLNKTDASTLLTLNDHVSVATINMTSGELQTQSKTLTITTTRTGNGIILGTIKRQHTFNTGVAYAFESPASTINLTALSGLTSITIAIAPGTVNDFPFVASIINREYTVTIPAGTCTGTLRLHYVDAELNGNVEANLNLWRNAGSWAQIGRTGIDNTANWVEQSALTQATMTGRWAICDGSFNVVKWTGATSTNWNTASNWTAVQGSPSTPPAANDIVQVGSAVFTNQPTISSAVNIRGLVFYSATQSTLTLASGGALTTVGTISGDWTAGNANHAINQGAQNLTVGGDILLSDGTSNHTIALNISTGTVTLTNNLVQKGGANITFSGAGNLNIGSNFNYTSGSFICNASTVSYNGGYAQVVGNVVYNHLIINKVTGTTTVLNNAITTNGNFTLVTGGRVDLNATLTVGGDVSIGSGTTLNANDVLITVGGDWSKAGTFIQGGGTIEFIGTGDQDIASTTFNNLKINKVSGSAIATGNLLVNSDFNIAQGIIDIVTYTASRTSLGGTMTLASGAILRVGGASNFPTKFNTTTIATNSTVEYNGTIAQNVLTLNYGNLTFSNGGSVAKTLTQPISINGDLTINSGATFNGGANTVILNGNWFNSGTFNPSTGAIIMSGTSKQIAGTNSFYDITITGSYSTLGGTTSTILNDLTTTGVFTQSSDQVYLYGSLFNTGTINLFGTTNIMGTQAQTIANNGTFVSGLTGIINYNGTIAPSILSTSPAQYATVNINNTDPAGIVPIQPWQVFVAMNVASGATFRGNGLTHTFHHSLTNNGTITNTSGTFTFDAAYPAGTLTFGSAFSCSGTVNFAGAQAITIAGAGTPSFGVVNVTNTHANGITPSSDWNIDDALFVGAASTFHGGTARTITLGGDLTVNGTFEGGTSSVIMTRDSAFVAGVGSVVFNNLTLNTAGQDSLLLDIGITGNFVANKKFNAGGFTVTFSGGNAASVSGTYDPIAFANTKVSKSSAILSLSQNIYVDGDLIIGSGATLDATSKTISVLGDWIHNGTFTAGTSTTAFIGIEDQQISGSSVCSFYDVTVNNSGVELSVANNVSLINRLTLAANSKINTTGYELTLLSNATTTGSIGAVPASATFIGNIRMQRYIPAAAGRYWYMAASPVSTGTVAMWQTGAPNTGFYVTGGFTGRDNPGFGIKSTSPNMYNWDANGGDWSPYPITNNSELVEPKVGYCVFIRDGNANYNGGATVSKTFSLLGPPNTGTQVFPLSYHTNGGTGPMIGGWNLIGNAFPSNITGNLSNAGWSNSGNMDGLATYIWDSDMAQYVSCNGGVGNCIVPSSQAFWVRVLPGGGTVTATENVKVTGSMSLYRKVAPTYIPVVLTNTQTKNNDVTYLRFEDDATLGFDNQYDAYKLRMAITASVNPVSISTEINKNVELSINARPIPKADDTIALRTLGNTGSYILDFTNTSNLDAEYNMLLLDKYTQTLTEISSQPVYAFDIASGDSATFNKRFFVIFSYAKSNVVVTSTNNVQLSEELAIFPNPYKSGDVVNVKLGSTINAAGQSTTLSITHMSGRVEYVEDVTNKMSKGVVSIVLTKKLVAGVYLVNVNAGEKVYKQKLFVY